MSQSDFPSFIPPAANGDCCDVLIYNFIYIADIIHHIPEGSPDPVTLSPGNPKNRIRSIEDLNGTSARDADAS
ncbi:hypothetical protein ASZ90_010914 [hydrocarbon metagenome]|uniref:Uncharacterized protein n=1 Tax=hydrocarbon metagenome TaxID=938273 RepID=A0A0W8FF13_9ZZZZ